MSIPRRVESKLSRKNRENPRIKPAPSSGLVPSLQTTVFLTHLFPPSSPFPCLFQVILFLMLSTGTRYPCCHQGKNKNKTSRNIHFINTLYQWNSYNLSSLWCQLSGNTCFPSSVHIAKDLQHLLSCISRRHHYLQIW